MVNAEKRRRTAAPLKPGSGKAPSSLPVAVDDGPPQRPAPTLTAQARYRFDLALSRGPMVVIGYLGVVMLIIIALASMVIWALQLKGVNGGGPIGSPFDAFWQALLRVVDSGTFAADATWPTRLLGLLITIAGIFLAGSLIGLIATAVDQQIQELRKGRSTVLEDNHTLVLGWSPRLATILAELVEANDNLKRAAVVVLAAVPKDEMEDELRVRVPDTRNTRVVCRTGDPASPADLAMVNVRGARSIVVLAGDDGDAGVVKAVLAVRSIDPLFSNAHVVAELDNPGHAATLRTLTEGRIVTIQADEIIAELTAQACHQAGLAAVFRELLDFDGDEIYFTPVPELDGATYRDALLAFEACSVLGWIRPDGVVELNPPAEATFGPGFEIITVAEDDDKVIFTGIVEPPAVAVDPGLAFTEEPQRVIMIGWSDLGPGVLRELDEFLAAGSSIDLVVDPALVVSDLDDLHPPLPETVNCALSVHRGGRGPEALMAMASSGYDQAIVLGYRHPVPVSEADARTMLTLLTLDKAFHGLEVRPRIVAEMLDRANVAVAQTTGVEDFIVSDELSSLMMAQLSERLELHKVFDELFDVEGAFISLHPAPLYAPGTEVTFAEIVTAASHRGQTAFGWRVADTAEVVVNPPKSQRVVLGASDQVLVLGAR
ncbi:CASTOR/POLLUX-related putative ion channel [Aquihabitans sp. McL0605]|uniref:CASTOR/POLLUX-related putative ion channel n=1 Tax=Aquihabitans sp. McL0605 TaxID=3415671 RepID=UPI003CEAF641